MERNDGTVEREQSQLASQAAASTQARIKQLEKRVTDLQHQLWTANQDNATLATQLHTIITIMARDGSLVAQSMLAAQQPEMLR